MPTEEQMMVDFKDKANLIWKVDDLLCGDYKQSDYGKVILPMTVFRWLDCVLVSTKQKVLDCLPKIEKLSDSAKDVTLNKVAGFNFHNRSQYDFAKLIADPDNIAANLRNFINGFSAGVPEILEHFTPREVKPHVPDAWIDEIKIKTGYEISFTKYFYEFNPLRPLAEIKADILKLEEETVELEKKVLA